MRLSCRRAVFPAAAAALVLACHDSTAPLPSEFYFLSTINGQPVPTVISAGYGDTTTVLWASFVLDGAGKAVTSTHYREVYLTNPPQESDFTLHWSYRVIGDSVAFYPVTLCPVNALCVGPPVGKLVDGALVIHDPYSGASVYLYRRVMLD